MSGQPEKIIHTYIQTYFPQASRNLCLEFCTVEAANAGRGLVESPNKKSELLLEKNIKLFEYPLRTSKTITNLLSCKDQQVDGFWEETVESFVDVMG